MKYFLQFEGKERLLLKAIFVAQIIIIILLFKIAFRPIELYINNKQLKEILIWQAYELDSNVEENEGKAVVEFSD